MISRIIEMNPKINRSGKYPDMKYCIAPRTHMLMENAHIITEVRRISSIDFDKFCDQLFFEDILDYQSHEGTADKQYNS